jgi:hypothetical protein
MLIERRQAGESAACGGSARGTAVREGLCRDVRRQRLRRHRRDLRAGDGRSCAVQQLGRCVAGRRGAEEAEQRWMVAAEARRVVLHRKCRVHVCNGLPLRRFERQRRHDARHDDVAVTRERGQLRGRQRRRSRRRWQCDGGIEGDSSNSSTACAAAAAAVAVQQAAPERRGICGHGRGTRQAQ